MKLLLVICALAALALAAPKPVSKTLDDDFADLLSLIPWVTIDQLVADYSANDADYQDQVAWIQSPEFAALGDDISNDPAVQDLLAALLDAGLDFPAVVQGVIDILLGKGSKATGQVRLMTDFMEELLALIPLTDLAGMVLTKLQSSLEFANFFRTLQLPESKDLFEAAFPNESLQVVCARLTSWGLIIQDIVDFIYAFLGW